MNTVNINKLADLDFQGKEAYKTLRTNIQFSGSDIKVIGLTSCVPNEGKSSVTLYLAQALAETNKKVLLIDADLRKSVLVGRFRIDVPVKGLTHYLSGLNKLEETTYLTNIDNLHMMFAGPVPPNPSELLGGKVFSDLVENLRQDYDYILIDTPPLGSIIDGAVVARLCDGMVLVIEANNISFKFAQKVKNQLEKTGCPILGAVLNKLDINKGDYAKYYGKSYGEYATVDLKRL